MFSDEENTLAIFGFYFNLVLAVPFNCYFVTSYFRYFRHRSIHDS